MALPKILVTLPAYKAARTLAKTLHDIPAAFTEHILLVDDASPDDTVAVARGLGLDVIIHPLNLGYGANQKTCYDAALAANADIIVLLHPDYQYDPKALPALVAPIINGQADFVFGSRFAECGQPLAGGMPFYRYCGNRLMTGLENRVLGTGFSELHSGLKAYSRRFLQETDYHRYSNSFVFDSQMLIEAILLGYRLAEVPIPTRYTAETSSINLKNSLLYVSSTLQTLLHRKLRQNRLRSLHAERLRQLSQSQNTATQLAALDQTVTWQ